MKTKQKNSKSGKQSAESSSDSQKRGQYIDRGNPDRERFEEMIYRINTTFGRNYGDEGGQ